MMLKIFVVTLITVASCSQQEQMSYFESKCQGKDVNVNKSTWELKSCSEKNSDHYQLLNKTEDAMIRGDEDVAVHTYCISLSQNKACIYTYMRNISTCFDVTQTSFFNPENDVIEQAIDGCHNNSKKIIAFMSYNKDFKCIRAKSFKAFQDCLEAVILICTLFPEDMLKRWSTRNSAGAVVPTITLIFFVNTLMFFTSIYGRFHK